ncbi:hypothetical protein [Brevibacterium otitidis]|uniref:Uncharacterized protein n=1 Tax=Brevibacterium otitidis TaxID=53364 RepID=A0ABV5X0D5_9MICO|nr:hypothetical protein GCM10023233_06920 [Brevibacterium otitidis]
MNAKTLTVCAGSLTFCAWGTLGMIVRSFLTGAAVAASDWILLAVTAILSAITWTAVRMTGHGIEALGILGSRLWSSATLFLFALSFALPGLLLRSSDAADLIVAVTVAAAIAALGQWILHRRVFSPPDSPDGLDGGSANTP